MSKQDKPAFVLVHGAWHSSACWHKTVAALEATGHAVEAVTLPGAGENAAIPAALNNRPLDAAAFGTEPSPNAGVTQQSRTNAVIDAVGEAAKQGNGKVVLVGHSLGGITLSPVCETIPDQIHAAVYLSAFLLPPGMPAVAMITSDIMSEALVPSLFMADPEQVGALRMDTASDDDDYIGRMREAFYADLSDEDFDHARQHLHCDEPVAVAVEPSPITSDNFGRVTRHYVRCTGDRAIPLAGQDHMIEAVDGAMGNKTQVHTLDASHSPFYSMPDQLSALLVDIAMDS